MAALVAARGGRGEDTEAAPSAFGTASLDDCGLDPETLKVIMGS